VSVRPKGQAEFGTRCEIKNLNSFAFMKKAIEFEARRQIELIEDGGTVRQETRLYDPDRDETRTMRSKEDAHDYRYFPDPDLPPLVLGEDWIEQVRAKLPELPASKQARYRSELGLTAYDASVLTGSKELADYFEAVIAQGAEAKPAANWVMGELAAALNKAERGINDSPVKPAQLALLLRRIGDGTLSSKTAKQVFEGLWNGDGEVDAIIETRGLKQMSDSGAIEKIIDDVLAANPKSVEEYRAGKDKAFNALVGQVMKQSRGKANPQQVNDILKAKLGN
jgi:aspartyl-tRNA(Asn)/glutamyl-tRNA(Gln) amidotransferase subunit B